MRFNQLSPERAIPACLNAINKYPGEARYKSGLGWAYYKKRDYKTAYNWIRRAADAGYPFAYLQLSEIYAGGRGVKRSRALQIRYLKRAESKNVPIVAVQLAYLELRAGDGRVNLAERSAT